MAINAVPIIDLAAFEHGDRATRAEIARLTDEACRHTGFLAIAHHGVDQNVIDTMWNTMQDFFDLPTSVKHQFKVPSPGYPYGYMGNEAETLAASSGQARPWRLANHATSRSRSRWIGDQRRRSSYRC